MTSFHPFREEDYEAVCSFLIRLNDTDRRHINWNWARFEWMYEHPEFDKTSMQKIGLWKNDEAVVGAAIYDMYFGEAFCAVLPGHEALYPEVLNYAAEELRDESGIAIAIPDGCQREREAAEALDFQKIEQSETIMELRLDELPDRALRDGVKIHVLDPKTELDAFQWLLWRGFDHGNDRAEFERSEPVRSKARPHFRKELSLAAVGPDGEYLSYCCLWYQNGTDYAYVEPVCTVPSARGSGLAGALLTEAFHRVRALGAKRAYVISDMAFYEKLGFEKRFHYSFYKKA